MNKYLLVTSLAKNKALLKLHEERENPQQIKNMDKRYRNLNIDEKKLEEKQTFL